MELEATVNSSCCDLPQSARELNQYRPKQQRLIKVGSVCGPLCWPYSFSPCELTELVQGPAGSNDPMKMKELLTPSVLGSSSAIPFVCIELMCV